MGSSETSRTESYFQQGHTASSSDVSSNTYPRNAADWTDKYACNVLYVLIDVFQLPK
jgi:hypothetical protein